MASLFSWFTCQPPHQHCRLASCREAPADAVFNAHSRFVFSFSSPSHLIDLTAYEMHFKLRDRHTHTHNTHARTHARTQAFTHARTPLHTHSLSPFSYACSHTQARTSCMLALGSPFYKLAFIHTLYTHLPQLTNDPPPLQKHHTHTHTHSHSHTHSHTPTLHVRMLYSCSHTQARISGMPLELRSHFYKLAFIHTLYTPLHDRPPPTPRTHTHAHARARAHTHTHTRNHTPPCPPFHH